MRSVFRTIAMAAALSALVLPSQSFVTAAASKVDSPRISRSVIAPSSHARTTHDVASDQAAVTALTNTNRGPGITVNEAVVFRQWALTTYTVNDSGDTGQCVFAWTNSGWYVTTCTGGWLQVTDIQNLGSVPYYIAYNLAQMSPQTWAHEQTTDNLNGQPLPAAAPCTPDDYGYCVWNVQNVQSYICGYPWWQYGQSMAVYNMYTAGGNGYEWTYVDDGNCNGQPSWNGPSPWDMTQDPSMPGGPEDSSGAPSG
jgi:hypothetical protein